MSRYPDSKSAGRSKLIPYKQGEGSRARHSRRLSGNLEMEDEMREWCAGHGIEIEVKNDGQHWLFTKGKYNAEWWPSSAKMILNKRWSKGTHVHDIRQAQGFLFAKFQLKGK